MPTHSPPNESESEGERDSLSRVHLRPEATDEVMQWQECAVTLKGKKLLWVTGSC